MNLIMHVIEQGNRMAFSTSVLAVCRYVSAAFWTGVLVGVVAACLCVAAAHQFLGLEYGFHERGVDRSLLNTNALGQQVHSNPKFGARWPSNL